MRPSLSILNALTEFLKVLPGVSEAPLLSLRAHILNSPASVVRWLDYQEQLSWTASGNGRYTHIRRAAVEQAYLDLSLTDKGHDSIIRNVHEDLERLEIEDEYSVRWECTLQGRFDVAAAIERYAPEACDAYRAGIETDKPEDGSFMVWQIAAAPRAFWNDGRGKENPKFDTTYTEEARIDLTYVLSSLGAKPPAFKCLAAYDVLTEHRCMQRKGVAEIKGGIVRYGNSDMGSVDLSVDGDFSDEWRFTEEDVRGARVGGSSGYENDGESDGSVSPPRKKGSPPRQKGPPPRQDGSPPRSREFIFSSPSLADLADDELSSSS